MVRNGGAAAFPISTADEGMDEMVSSTFIVSSAQETSSNISSWVKDISSNGDVSLTSPAPAAFLFERRIFSTYQPLCHHDWIVGRSINYSVLVIVCMSKQCSSFSPCERWVDSFFCAAPPKKFKKLASTKKVSLPLPFLSDSSKLVFLPVQFGVVGILFPMPRWIAESSWQCIFTKLSSMDSKVMPSEQWSLDLIHNSMPLRVWMERERVTFSIRFALC